MNEFEFSVHTLCLMDKANLERMLKEKDPANGCFIEAVRGTLQVYDKDDCEGMREGLKRELYNCVNPIILGRSVGGESF